jgi:Ca-activated chloride channel family protein
VNEWIHFGSPRLLHLLWLIPLAGIALWLFVREGHKALDRITLLRDRLSSLDRWRRLWKQILSLLSLAFLALALARPAWNPRPLQVRQEGRDVVFAVDVSLSMLAQDLAPNRLKRAILAILDTLPALEGDRVAVVAFAGSATVVCPLTRDYGFFQWAVEGLNPASAETPGTLIGDAIRKVCADVFDPKEKRFKDLILISDGEDQGSYPVHAAAAAGGQGVRIISIGIGDDTAGARIPIRDQAGATSYLTYQGQEVWSRLQPDTLRQTALATPGGRFLNAATGSFDLGLIYRQLIADEEKRDLGPVQIIRYTEQFQLFLLVALALLFAEAALGEQARRAKEERP